MEILGWIANLFFFTGGLFKNPRHTMANYLVADILFVVMYVYMGLMAPALAMAVTCARIILALVLSDRWNKYSVISTTAISTVMILVSMDMWADYLIVFAAIAIGMSAFYRDDFLKYRACTITSQVLWIVHSLIFGIYSMLFSCLIVLGTCIYALIMYTSAKDIILAQFTKIAALKVQTDP